MAFLCTRGGHQSYRLEIREFFSKFLHYRVDEAEAVSEMLTSDGEHVTFSGLPSASGAVA